MKVKELIEKLQAFDPEMEVRRHDDEWGAEEIEGFVTGKDYSVVFATEYENVVIIQ